MDAVLSALRKRYGKLRVVQPVLSAVDFPPVSGRRRAEVAMAIRRPTGAILLQTKEFYPAGAYRLPTGGIKEGEDVEHALLREVEEESNLDVEIERFVAAIEYLGPEGRPAFRSYLYLLRETGGVLRVNDPKERISGWEARDAAGLRDAIANLRSLGGTWTQWGRFRALVLEVLIEDLA
jgi:ADP-ribose pyrophosphatase YjhB (NUDIX family)